MVRSVEIVNKSRLDVNKNIDNYNLGDKACRHRIILSTWFSVAFYYELFLIKKNEP